MKTESTVKKTTVPEPGIEPAAWNNSLKSLRAAMPFLVTLPPDVRLQRRTPGQTSVAWIERTLTVIRDHPDSLPGSFDRAHYLEDAQLTLELQKFLVGLYELVAEVKDTLSLVGGRAVEGSRQVSGHIRMASRTTPGLKNVAETLSPRTGIRRTPRKAADAPLAAPESPPPVSPTGMSGAEASPQASAVVPTQAPAA